METQIFQILSAWLLPVVDCDEVFNYWEPLHYLQYGSGSQVWEYSPDYALRSYFFISLHYLSSLPFALLPRPYVFKLLRVVLALFSLYCQNKLIKTLNFPRLTYYIFNISPGILLASHSFLPSTFSMNCNMLALAYFYQFYSTKDYTSLFYSLLSCSFAMVVGWPFVSVIFAAFAIPYLIKFPAFLKTPRFYIYGITALAITIVPSLVLDTIFYKRPVLSVLNVLIYNTSLGKNLVGSSLLFGTEPWSFYFKNLFLNFNIVNPT